jgi:hypothetical protein
MHLQEGITGEKTMYDAKKIQLFKELVKYERQGVNLWMDQYPSTAVDIVHSDVLREEGVYMRDYIADEKGVVKELHFDRISEE